MGDDTFYYLTAGTKGPVVFYGAYAAGSVIEECPRCKARRTKPHGAILMEPAASRGTFWPDATYCFGGIMGLYVSQRVREILDAAAVRYGEALPAEVEGQFPKKLLHSVPPKYFYLTGEFGAKFDFTSAGMLIEEVCSCCGRIKRKAQGVGRYSFVEGSWNGSDIFHTDLSPSTYFCTERIVELAKLHRWTNFKFIPLKEAHDSAHHGINYLS